MRFTSASLAEAMSGDWTARTVTAVHDNLYEDALVTVTTEGGAFRATVHHPIWVVSGRELAGRPTCKELSPGENEGESLPGRWVNSHDLRPGDVLLDRHGVQQTVLRTEQEYVSAEPVFNLTVEGLHTYAIGEDGLLVHNACADPVTGTPQTVGQLRDAKQKDAHHIIQDAAVRDLPGYDTRSAPGVRLDGPANRAGTPHNATRAVQRESGGGTYGAERRIGYKALRKAGFSPKEARSEVERADEYFSGIGVDRNTPTRIPGDRS